MRRLIVLLVLLVPASALAQNSEADRAVRAKLESLRVDLKFKETTFAEAVQVLRDSSALNIHVDAAAAELLAGQGVTLELSGVRLSSALNWLVRGRGLAWKVVDGVVLIATRESAADKPVLELYDVSDILSLPRDFPAEGTADTAPLSLDDLRDVIECVVDPGTWESPISIEIAGRNLVVVAPPGTQAKIGKLLATFRVAAHFTVTYDARVVDLSPKALAGAPSLASLAPGKALLTRDEAASLLASADARVVEAARFTCMNGQRVGVSLERVENVAAGMQGSAASGANLTSEANGRETEIDVRSTLVVGRDLFAIDLDARLADEALPPATVRTPRGDVACSRRSGRAVRTSFQLPNGGAGLFVLGASGDRVRALLLRVSSSAPSLSTSKPIEPVPAEEASAAEFRQFEAKKVSLTFSETPLADVVRELRAAGGMNMLVDPLLVASDNADLWKVTLVVKDMEIRAVLGLVQMMFDVVAVVRDDAVLLTRRENAEDPRIELYDVRDLVRTRSDWPGPLIERPEALFATEGESALSGAVDAGTLQDLIRQSIAPGTWDDSNRAALRQAAGTLIILQTPSGHRAVSEFLSRLREAKPRPLQVDARLLDLDPSVHDALDAGGDGPLPDASRAAIERALADGRARTVAAWSLLGSDSQRFHAVQAARRRYLERFPEHAPEPNLGTLAGGHYIDLRATFVPSEAGSFVVELRTAGRDVPADLPTASGGATVVETPRGSAERLATTVVTRSGETRLFSLGNVAGAKGDLRRVLVWTVRAIE